MRSSFILAALAAVLMACTPETERGRPGAGDAETGMSGAVAGRDTASSGTPTGERPASLVGLLSQLELANTAEIETAKLATTRARSREVKRVAQQLLSDHTKNRDQLESLAKKKGINLVPPAGGDPTLDTTGAALQKLEGAEFDRAFVAAQIEAHRANIDAIRNQMLPAAKDPDVREYLEQTLAAMEKHLADLEQVQGQLEA